MTLPRALQRVIATAIARAPSHAEEIDRHYAQLMPHARAEQLQHDLLRAPLRWDRLPRMRGALARLRAVLEDASIDASGVARAMRARTLAELYAQTYFGAAMPMQYASPAELAYFESRKLTTDDTIDRYLTAPVLRELCFLDRDREALCPHLDASVATWLGVHVWPELAYPAPGHDDALPGVPWFAQIGAALVRVFGARAVLRAHAGDLAALPRDLVAEAERLNWKLWDVARPVSFLADMTKPQWWLELITAGRTLAADPAQDRAIVADALRAMCVETDVVAGSVRARSVVPAAPIVIERGSVTTPTASYWLPATVDTRERRDVVLGATEDISGLAAELVAT